MKTLCCVAAGLLLSACSLTGPYDNAINALPDGPPNYFADDVPDDMQDFDIVITPDGVIHDLR